MSLNCNRLALHLHCHLVIAQEQFVGSFLYNSASIVLTPLSELARKGSWESSREVVPKAGDAFAKKADYGAGDTPTEEAESTADWTSTGEVNSGAGKKRSCLQADRHTT